MMRWWWFGPSVVKPELEREMRAMKEGGIGGFEVQPVYPLEVEGNYPYLSPQFLDALKFTGEKARELGLRMDLTLCSGWPYGGPHISVEQASARLRVQRVTSDAPPPAIGEGEMLIAVFVDNERLPDGARVPAGKTAQYFIASRTKQMVKRPAVGSEGWVLDHYNRSAIDFHLKTVGEKLMGALGKNVPYAVFSDSLEVYNADWTADLLPEFQKRRGYDLTPYLPALAGDIGAQTAAIRHDWGKTLTELANERYLTPVRQWASAHGTKFRSQTYGIPPVELSSNALVDLPEGEGSFWRRFTSTRWASSGSHLYGQPVTSSETWTWLHSPVFRATPLDMKAEGDLHFLQGVNQLIGHGWPYSPPEAGEPGWRFYASAVFNQHNPWWIVMPDVTKYLQRVSFLLRQGRPANDVAIYLPTDDAWAGFGLGRDSINQAMEGLLGPNLIPRILDAGYNFDFIDDGAIEKLGVQYPVLILPGVNRIPLATYQRIGEYAKKGGKVIVTRRAPSEAPGFKDDGDTAKIRELSGAYTVTDEAALAGALHAALPPDVATAPEIGVVHRKLPFAEVYFLANTSNHPVKSAATFRVARMDPQWWDPFSGKVTGAGAGNRLELDLAPYESRVVVFAKGAAAGAAPAKESTAVDISAGWSLQIGGKTATADVPRSWTDDPDLKFFSGTATYEKTVQAAQGRSYVLDFGEGTPVNAEERRAGAGMRAMLESPVREAAIVYVNGKRAGSVWKPPYQLDVTGLMHAGENQIRIVVANTAVNVLAKGPLPDYKELTAKYTERFQAQDMDRVQPLPSGLLGPIRLVTR